MNIQKQKGPGIYNTTLSRQGLKEFYITVWPEGNEKSESMINRLAGFLKKQNAEVIKFDVFGPVKEYSIFHTSLQDAIGQVDWPITWVEGGCCAGGDIAGMQVRAVSGIPVETIKLEHGPAARTFEDSAATYCFLGNILPNDSSRSREEQALETLVNIEQVLKLSGMDMLNIIRTWFYNYQILDWYSEFNKVRNSFFTEKGIFNKFLPASTGIGGSNPANTALIASAFAVKAKGNNLNTGDILSPKQGPAPGYGSSFSRAAEVISPEYHQVLVSGTASINARGDTIHIGKVDEQIEATMDIVEAIIQSRGMKYEDVTQAVIYFKHARDAAAFTRYCKNRGLFSLPAVISHSDLCRDNLLFEIEVEAVNSVRT